MRSLDGRRDNVLWSQFYARDSTQPDGTEDSYGMLIPTTLTRLALACHTTSVAAWFSDIVVVVYLTICVQMIVKSFDSFKRLGSQCRVGPNQGETVRGGKMLKPAHAVHGKATKEAGPSLSMDVKASMISRESEVEFQQSSSCRVFGSPLHISHVYEEVKAHPSIVRSVYVVKVHDLLLRIPPCKRSLLFSQLMAACFARHLL